MNKIYILHSGVKIIEDAVNNCKYRDKIILFNPSMNSIFARALRKIHCNSILNSKSFWIDKILNENSFYIEDQKDNTMIIFDAPIWIKNVSYLRKKFKNIKIVFWYWNIIKDIGELENIKKYSDFVFTFDKKESEKYGLNYNPQFYWLKNPEKEVNEIDLFFIGRNKNRLFMLENIYLECIKNNIKTLFYIVKDNKKDKSNFLELKMNGIPYSEVLKLINKSKCILDINQVGQIGLTLRVLEALFLKKKLITNNIDLKNYDFFNKNNILILDVDNKISSDFINSDFIDVDDNIIEKYTIDSWIKKLTGSFQI